jgi:hypothetical protein
MVKKIADTKLGYRETWYCELCDGFYSEKRLKEIIFNIKVNILDALFSI